MLKNNDQRKKFIQNKDNWVVLDELETLHLRVLVLKINKKYSLIKFEKRLSEKEKQNSRYSYLKEVKVGDYVPFDMGNDFYKLVDGELVKPSLLLSKAIELVKNAKEDE